MGLGRRLAFAPMLALSLWAALPWVEWCSMSWRDCIERCSAADLAVCAEATACAPRVRAIETASACGAASDCADRPTSREPAPGDRAWCLHAPLAGVGPRGLALDAPIDAVPLAVLAPPPPQAGQPVAAVRVALERHAPHPAVAHPHAPPLGRAPPLA